jgi:hypothetical protein
MSTKNPKNPSYKFKCVPCDYCTSNLKDFNKHKQTKKHFVNILSTVDNIPSQEIPYSCEFCNKTYKERTGLWRHKQKCEFIPKKKIVNVQENDEGEIKILTNLILDVVKQNNELTNKIVDICKTSQTNNTNNINNGNINSNNKTFNLNVYLNETCKNAMNISDFIDSLQLQLSDLESIGKLGFVEGISHIIAKKLNSLDETERPVHCTDRKRETVYIKDENKWEKEDEDKNKLRKVIKKVAFKNEKLLPKFKEVYPDYNDSDSKRSDQYSKIVIEAMGGNTDEPSKDKEDKIIKKIVKGVTINKMLGSIENID